MCKFCDKIPSIDEAQKKFYEGNHFFTLSRFPKAENETITMLFRVDNNFLGGVGVRVEFCPFCGRNVENG